MKVKSIAPAIVFSTSIGLEPLLRYVSDPSGYIREHRDDHLVGSQTRAEWDAWAKSRAAFVHRKLFEEQDDETPPASSASPQEL